MFNPTSSLPSCSYCRIQSKTSLVQCQAESCQKWFCNHKAGLKGSHIYLHLHAANHREISSLSSQISTTRTLLRCEECQETNIYALSIVQHKKTKIILCHDTCLQAKSKKEYQRLGPVIEENKISGHIIPKSKKEQPKQVRLTEIEALEKLWRKNLDPNSGDSDIILDYTEIQKKIYLSKAPDQFDSVEAYRKMFLSLLQVEAEYEKNILEALIHHNVEVIWKKVDDVVYAELNLSNATHFKGTLKEGDFLILESKDAGISRGNVAAAKKDKKILVRFAKRDVPENTEIKYTVKPVWNAVSHRRMKEGLKMIASGRLSKTLALHLLGTPPQTNPNAEPKYTMSNCFELQRYNLNESQREAAFKALNAESVFLIQGPPGTGKTHTLGALIAQVNKSLGKYHKILVCGSSNKAVNTITEKLIENGVEGICRIYAVSKENSQLPATLKKVALHNLVKAESQRIDTLIQKQKDNKNLSLKELKELKTLRGRIQETIIRNSRVICCTCATAGDGRLEGFIFKNVFIDEAAQATEPECVLPWLYGAEKVILSGDHKQISPIIQSPEAKKAGLSRSLFERLVANPDNFYMLKYQYRMNPAISEFPSRHFYQNQLIPDSSLAQREFQLKAPFKADIPNFFYHVSGKEEIPAAGVSQMNREEAQVVMKIVYKLLDSGVKPSQIGIITFYNGQKALLTELIDKKRSLSKKIDISSVDGFQGGEKDYIIISCVRSNDELGIGFLCDEKRLNVALTRAKHGMIVCGNSEVLKRDPNWKALVEYYHQKGHIFEGDLKRLKPYHSAYPKTG